MKPYIIYQVMKADLLERVRRSSFLAMCVFAMFLAFFSVPDVEAPLVSICMEPGIFSQGSNPSWIPIAIALCGGVLFPMIGLSFVKNNISMDRESGLLYGLQSMNMKKGNYIIGKFLSNLSMLTVMWLFVMLGAALMLPFRFPDQPLPFYDFISPFIGIYPGIVFAAAFAVLLESVPFISSKAGNAVGLTALFVMFLVNYSASGYDNPLLGAFDYGNYRWVMDSINDAVVPMIGREVQETGILVPGGMFADSKGGQELVFHGLLWNRQYLMDKIILTAISMALILSAVILLETTEKRKKASSRSLREKGRKGGKSIYCTNQFMMECRLLLKSLPKGCLAVNAGLWVYSIFAPLQYVQGYLWIIMLICSVALFSQMGCREHEKEKRVLNKKETTLAAQKQDTIREAFKDWVFRDPDRRQDLVAKYNKLFNSTRPREYDGAHLKFPGMTPDIELKPHQKSAVAHVLYGDNTLLAHCVGAGKTFEMTAAAMESKRLGLCQKSLFVVPNHLTEQWASDFLRLYPGANILAATKKDFEPANRKKFCSRIATGDYDAVIIGHSQFEKIPLSIERQEAMIERQISEIELAIEQAKADNGERYTIKQMEKTRKSLSARLEKLNDASRKAESGHPWMGEFPKV